MSMARAHLWLASGMPGLPVGFTVSGGIVVLPPCLPERRPVAVLDLFGSLGPERPCGSERRGEQAGR